MPDNVLQDLMSGLLSLCAPSGSLRSEQHRQARIPWAGSGGG
jgi:hypothetical protein